MAQKTREIASERRNIDPRPGLSPADRATRLAELANSYAITDRLQKLEARDPNYALKALDYPAMADLARKHKVTLLYLVPTDEEKLGTVAFIVPSDGAAKGNKSGPEVCTLPGLARTWLHDLFFRLPKGAEWGPRTLQAEPDQLGWLTAYWRTHLARAEGLREVAEGVYEGWRATTSRLLHELGTRLLQPLAATLRALSAHRVIIIPGGNLALLRLHAAPLAGKPVIPFGVFPRSLPATAGQRTCPAPEVHPGGSSQPGRMPSIRRRRGRGHRRPV